MVDAERDPLALLTLKELCELLKISRFQVYDEIKYGHLPAYRLGPKGRAWRFKRRDVEAYLVGGTDAESQERRHGGQESARQSQPDSSI